ncbi:MAG: protein-glutamate O-methyltransferase CheR [Anaerolineae bacterium]|nr:protein-glutamate O-methyltransferase CheR [Anaerolineae bacterium]
MDPINLKHEMDDLDYACFLDLIRKKSGLEIPAVRRPEVERSIHQLLSQINLIDVRELLGLINQDKRGNELLETLIGRITIGETYFFRNHSQFEALETTILPEIINRRRTNKQLRIWSAGCSTGEEPYSLAILLKKLLPDWSEWNIFILATDINRNALEKAQKREFGASSFRKETPPDIKQTYFATNGNKYILKPSIAEMVNFNYLNLVEDVYPSFLNNTTMMDLILCRNVFIYFKEETSQRIANALYDALGENGWLIVGHAEPSQTVFQKFRIHNFPGTIIYQKSEKGNHTPEITTSARVNRVSQKIEIRKNANRIMPGRIKNTIKAGNITQNVNQVNTLSPVDATGEMLNKDLQEADRLIRKVKMH